MEKLGDKKKYYKKMLIYIFIVAILFTFTVLASDVIVKKITEDKIQYLYFELEHNLSNAQYKYYGYGYTVTIYDNDNKKEIGTKYLPNSEFIPQMIGNKEVVKISVEKIFDKLNVDKEFYYRDGCYIYLNGRLGIKVNNTLTRLYDSYEGTPAKGINWLQGGYSTEDGKSVPLNKDLKGIANGLKYEYGVSWTPITYMNLKQHFGINYKLDPVFLYDGYEVQYKEVATEKTVSSEKALTNFNEARTITEYPDTVNGYEYSGYYEIKKVDSKGNSVTPPPKPMTQGDSATVNLQQTASIYTIIFYYNKIDLSQIGKPVTVDVEYRESISTGKQLSPKKTILSANYAKFNVSGINVDEYKCKGYFVVGKKTEYFYETNASLVISKEPYSTPVNDKLKIIFIYEKIPYVSLPKCEPETFGKQKNVEIYLKRKDFDAMTNISVSNEFTIDDFISGKNKKGEDVPGKHELAFWDLYIRDLDHTETYSQVGNIRGTATQYGFSLPKNIFQKVNENLYRSKLDIQYAGFCTCFDGHPDQEGNYGFDPHYFSMYVDVHIIENKPPEAFWNFYTKKKLPNGKEDILYDRAYIGKETIIKNLASDPNGKEDIKKVIYKLKDSKGKIYTVNLLTLQDGSYLLESDDVEGENIIFGGIDEWGNIKLKFLTGETWVIEQYVEDLDGLNDTYINNITPVELNLKPTAVIKDEREYRYPVGQVFNGKQNRVIMLNSNDSFIAEYLENMGVSVNHTRDSWMITPLDNQDVETVKFDKDINAITEGNILTVKYVPLNNIKMMFKQPGRYLFRLQVTDTDGNVSDWSEQIITIHSDLSPSVTADINQKYYRNTSKTASITFNALPASSDYDIPKIKNIGYKFDSNNNDSFDDEAFQNANLVYKEVNIGGVIYTQIALTTSKVGKYQFKIEVAEEFGQETIARHIEESDKKTASIVITTEVDNIAPVASLGLQKENNIDVKILTSGLTGTRNQDVQNNLNNLKNWLESENNIKVGNIEIIDIGKSINGLEKGLNWQKVMISPINYRNFWYTQNELTKERILLPFGVYAEGWNGIPIPKIYISNQRYFNEKDGFMDLIAGYYRTVVNEDFFDFRYGSESGRQYIEIGYLNVGNYDNIDAMESTAFSAVTDFSTKDFDISFNFEYMLRGAQGLQDSLEPHYLEEYFLFNVQDKNNYFAVLHHDLNDKKTDYLNKYYDYPWELIQVNNGVQKTIHKFSKDELGGRNIERLVQKGNFIEMFDSWGNKLYSGNIDEHKTGGRLGIAGRGGSPYAGCLKTLKLNIRNLTFIENASIYDSISRLNWKENSDKYIINLVEGTKIEELTNSAQLNKTAGKLQAEEINLINIGVNYINETKLKELITKNQNNGTYIELGNVNNNLNFAASYIRNKYSGHTAADEYMLLGDTIRYLENYSDAENDVIFSKEYKLNHLHTYFENNLGVIDDNNVWKDSVINTFNKTGKFTLNYRTKDNPLFPDLSIWNLFDNYRRYSNIFSKDIYVHRKPIASFNIDKSFKDNTLIKTTLLLKDLMRTYPYKDGDGSEDEYYDAEVDYVKNEVFMESDNRQDNSEYSYATFTTEIPNYAMNPVMSYQSYYWYITKRNGSSTSQRTSVVDYFEPGTKIEKVFSLYGRYYKTEETISNFKIEYYQPNPNVQVKITENSYDIDHRSLSNKGIIEWQWKIVDKDGITTVYNTINQTAGIDWVQNALSTNQKWKDASVQLRVKDMEGVYSDWTETYIDEGAVLDPDVPDVTHKKPIADFVFDKNPVILNSGTQKIYDNSYDPEGLALTYLWNVKKAGTTLFTGYVKNIDTQLNQEIIKNGVGMYEISLTVTNTKGVQSDTVSKSFDVVLYNDAPTVNFNLVSNQNPTWVFPKALGLYTLRYRPSNTLFSEEYARFDTYINDPSTDNTGFVYNWKLERFAVKDISNISGTATNTYNYTTQFPFVNSFKNQGLGWGAYRITLKVTDKPPIPPYVSTDAKSATVTKNYYIVPEISLVGSFESSKSEIMVGDTIKLKSTTSKLVESVNCTLDGTTYDLSKSSEDGSFIYWEKEIVIPESITESGTYNLSFIGKTTYGGNGNVTREVKDNVPIDIIALKLINFRITNIVNHPYITFPYTKDMLISNLIPYKTGYNVTFLIDSKGKPNNVYGRIDVGNNGTIDQNINLTKVVTGDTETWQGKFYTPTLLPSNTVISIKLDCEKGTTTYNYNEKENWDGRSLIVNGSALQDGRINLTR